MGDISDVERIKNSLRNTTFTKGARANIGETAKAPIDSSDEQSEFASEVEIDQSTDTPRCFFATKTGEIGGIEKGTVGGKTK